MNLFFCFWLFLTRSWFGESRICFTVWSLVFNLLLFLQHIFEGWSDFISFVAFYCLSPHYSHNFFFLQKMLWYYMHCVTMYVILVGYFFPCFLSPAKVHLLGSLHLSHTKKIVSRWNFIRIMYQHESFEMQFFKTFFTRKRITENIIAEKKNTTFISRVH